MAQNRQEWDFSSSDWLFTMCWLICEHNAPLPPFGVTNDSPSKTFDSSITGIEYGSVMQPSVHRVDVQSPLSGDTDPFRRDNNEGEDKALQATFHVYSGENFADLGQQVLVKILQHGGKKKENRVVLNGWEWKVGLTEIVGQYGAVHVFHAGQKLLALFRIHLGTLHDKLFKYYRKISKDTIFVYVIP